MPPAMRKEIIKTIPEDMRKKNSARKYQKLLVVGWREWVSLPDLAIAEVKAKIDTGAKTSALHAYDIEEFTAGRQKMVKFKINPNQKDPKRVVKAEAPLVEKRFVRDSGGKRTLRPVILTEISLGGLKWEIELTLVNRDAMGFRMLLGREALKGHLLVNPSTSFIWGHRTKD